MHCFEKQKKTSAVCDSDLKLVSLFWFVPPEQMFFFFFFPLTLYRIVYREREEALLLILSPEEEGGVSLSELTSFIIRGHSARRPQTVHVVSLCGSGERGRGA